MHIGELIHKLLSTKTVRNGGLFSMFSFFNRGVSFLLLVLLAEYIHPEQYGELSIFNTFVMFLGYFVGLSTSGYLSVAYFKGDAKDFKKDFSVICIVTLLCSLAVCIIFGLFQDWMAVRLKIPVKFLYVGLTIAFANIFVQLNLDYLRVQEKVYKYGVLSCLFSILNLVITLLLVIVVDMNWEGRVYAQMLCDIVFGLIALVWFFHDKILVAVTEVRRYKKVVLWGLPLIPHLASNWIKSGLDRYIIEDTHTMADVGLFSFAMNLAGIVLMFGVAFNQTNSVNLYQTLSSSMTPELKIANLLKKERYFIVLYLVLSVFIALGGLIAVPFFLTKYVDCIPYFLILVFYGFFNCVYFVYCNYLFYYSETKHIMYITFGSSVLHLVLSLLLTRYSLVYTCSIYVVVQALVSVLVWWRSKKCLAKYLLSKE